MNSVLLLMTLLGFDEFRINYGLNEIVCQLI